MFINEYMHLNDTPPSNITVGYQVQYSNDDNIWEVTDHQPNDYQIAREWYEELCKQYPYVELTCEVCGIFGDNGDIDEFETLVSTTLAKYERE